MLNIWLIAATFFWLIFLGFVLMLIGGAIYDTLRDILRDLLKLLGSNKN